MKTGTMNTHIHTCTYKNLCRIWRALPQAQLIWSYMEASTMPSVMLSDGFWLVVLGWLFFTLLQSTLIYKARWNFSIARACPSEVRNNQPIQFPLFTHHKKCHALAWFLTRIIETFSSVTNWFSICWLIFNFFSFRQLFQK